MGSNLVHLLQITDLHLQEKPEVTMRGENVEARFCAVLNQLMRQSADALLLTGDLSHHAPAAYDRLSDYLNTLPFPSFWIPGNHDLLGSMVHHAGNGFGRKVLQFQTWRILMLDSTSQADGLGGGSLAETELSFLVTELDDVDDAENVLLVMHHNPISVQSDWQDQIGLGNADQFWSIAERYPQVKAVIFGHVHQEWQAHRGNIQLFSSPATAPQFKKRCQTTEIEREEPLSLPAYTAYTLYPDGKITASVNRVRT